MSVPMTAAVCVTLTFAATASIPAVRAGGHAYMDSLERKLEMGRHAILAGIREDPSNALLPFTTDGCSGGMSLAWRAISHRYPEFGDLHGGVPPWEFCCEIHDRAYHAGGPRDATPEESFRARRAADRELRQCVAQVGVDRAPALSVEYDVPVSRVIELYDALAAVMYRAVRMGGVPCSGLPWRWGYGWPECP